MIIIRLQGGLGNQMFQYAAAKSLAIATNKYLYLDTSFLIADSRRDYYLGSFPGLSGTRIVATNVVRKKLEKIKSLLKQLNGTTNNVMVNYYHESGNAFNSYRNLHKLEGDIIYLRGYFQCERYFKRYKDEILRLFRKPLPSFYLEILRKMGLSESVAVHFRRGDYVTNPEAVRLYAPCDKEYYQRCIESLQAKISKKLSLFIFSDEIAWVKAHFSFNGSLDITFMEGSAINDPTIDMMLMSNCKYHITANSTYSWWGAWLCAYPDKIICTPVNWFNLFPNADLIPEGWILL